MGNGSEKSKAPATLPPIKPIEIKAYVMACQSKMSLFRNKKVYEIKKKKDEAILGLKQNNLDIAKAKMESIIRSEDMITVYDILGPLCEILKERITYLCEASEVPIDIKPQLDTIIYASTRVDIEELLQLRTLVQRKFGNYYIQAAEQNKDGTVNINVVEKLRIKPPVDAFIIIRLKQLCKEKKVNYDFPEELAPSFDQNFTNQFGGNEIGGNPYEYGNPNNMGNNPYGNNPYAPPNNNNMGGGNDFDTYMKNGGGNNPYGVGNNPNEGGNNPYGGGNNQNGGGNNPFGNNNIGDIGGNPYENNNNIGGNNNMGGNPYETGNNAPENNPFNDPNNNSSNNPYS